MIKEVFKANGKVPAKIWTDQIEDEAYDQIDAVAQLPFVFKHIAVMPDVHAGIGSTVGSVIPTAKAIIPAAVGVDIGCGMMAARLTLKASDLPDDLGPLRHMIETRIPHGRTDNGGANDRGAWGTPPPRASEAWTALSEDPRFLSPKERHPKLFAKRDHGARQLGTLGTGNHLVEVCLDKEDNVWVMLHSGSRGIGNRIGTYFIDTAKEECERWHVQLPDANLAYLPEGTELFKDYWNALNWAQDYARENRRIMMWHALDAMDTALDRIVGITETAINCHHNYATLENHFGRNVYVTRKGAIRARKGDLGIIPGSMGARSFIVRGLGNPESFCSCSHGAGRRMSRTQARRLFTAQDLADQTIGIECRKDEGVVDEIPSAYKDIDQVMANQTDLVEVVAELRQILCVKG